jgi:hypothetical protein
MNRGLRAQLSPNEESTLWRIARATPAQEQLRPTDVAQLVALQLVEIRNGVWCLTEMGSQRLAKDEPLREIR